MQFPRIGVVQVVFACLIWLACTFTDGAIYPDLDAVILKNLRDWAEDHGAKLNKIRWPVTFPQSGRGMAAVEDIPPLTEFIEIPLKLCIRYDSAKDQPIGKVADKLSDYLGAVITLANEKLLGNASFYKPFMDYLPSDYDGVETWSNSELEEFQDNRIKLEAINRRKTLREDYILVKKIMKKYGDKKGLKHMENMTLELFSWAWQTVGTRSFGFAHEGRSGANPTLVPIADLMNHNPSHSGAWSDNDGVVRITTGHQDHFPAGSEVLISYGSETTFATLFYYGFVIPGNPRNTEPLRMPETDNKPLRVSYNENKNELEMKSLVKPNELLGFFRLLAARNVDEMSSSSFPVSVERETAAAKMCVETINEHVNQKGTPLDFDLELLALHRTNKAKLNRHMELALLYRIDQKIIAHRNKLLCIRLIEQVLPCLTDSGLRKPAYFKRLRLLRAGVMQKRYIPS